MASEDGLLHVVPPLQDIDTYVTFELQASSPYAVFVYRDLELAREVHTGLVRTGAGEFAAPHGHLVLDGDGSPVGMYTAPFTRGDLQRVRLQGALALSRMDAFVRDPDVRERMVASKDALLTLREGDVYLSRIAVASDTRGRGLGRQIFELFARECAVRSAARIVLEVADEHVRARALYRRLGFREIGRGHASSPSDTSPALDYTHLALDLSASPT